MKKATTCKIADMISCDCKFSFQESEQVKTATYKILPEVVDRISFETVIIGNACAHVE